jgi:RNA 3'-terminal phosphate cyclase (ATP)
LRGDVNEITLDGSRGEGGGQILRTALALSAATGRAFLIEKIRAGRKKPGLAAQHLASVRAAAAVCEAKVEGDRTGSLELSFRPVAPRALKTHFEIGTAGSTSLVLQTIAVPLALAGGESEVTIGGGTHVEWSPAFDYLSPHWTAWMGGLGLRVRVKLRRAGYYPRGGGLIRARIAGGARPKLLLLDQVTGDARRGREAAAPPELRGKVVITRLDEAIARRIVRTATKEIEREGLYAPVDVEPVEGPSPGIAFFLYVSRGGITTACFNSLGRRGKPAEKVAHEAARELLAHLDACKRTGRDLIDPYLADQLVLPLSLAPGASRYATSAVTRHLLTNLETAAAFTGMRYEVAGEIGEAGEVRIVRAEASRRKTPEST